MDYLIHLQLMDLERICPWASSSIPSYCTMFWCYIKHLETAKRKTDFSKAPNHSLMVKISLQTP